MNLKRYLQTTGIVLVMLLAGQSAAHARALCLNSIANYTDVKIIHWGQEQYEDVYHQILEQVSPHKFMHPERCSDNYMVIGHQRLSIQTGYSGKVGETDDGEFVRFGTRIKDADTKKQYLMSDDNQCQNAGTSAKECAQRYTLIYDFDNPGAYPDCFIEQHWIHKSVIYVKASVYQFSKPAGGLEYRVTFSCVTNAEHNGAVDRKYASVCLPGFPDCK